MRFKFVMILIIILVTLAVSAVSAADNVTSDVVGADATDDVVSVSNNNQVITEGNNSVGSFAELETEINNVEEGGVLNLTKDYKYVNGSNNGIQINKSITIDGNNHTLDGKKLSCIFSVSASNVIIKNINFINGKGYLSFFGYNGGAIYWTGSNGNLYNCTFSNNFVVTANNYYSYGGAICWSGSSGTIEDCKFINNSANSGGAIEWRSAYGKIMGCIFENNKATSEDVVDDGGAIRVSATSKIINCKFINNSAKSGGAIYSYHPCSISNCKFINNSAGSGSAICSYYDCSISNCIFEGNIAKGKGTYSHHSGKSSLSNCKFINNIASSYFNVYYTIDEDSSLSMRNNTFGCKFKINANNITYGEVVNVRGLLDYGVNHNLNIILWEGYNRISDYTLGNQNLYAPYQFSFELSKIPSGNHSLKITVDDDMNFYNYTNNCIFSVTGLFTEISAFNVSSYYKENSYVRATLKNDKGQVLSDLNVDIDVNGNVTTLTTNKTGQILFNTNNLPVGKYTAIITFNGNYMYDKSYSFSTIIINKASSKLEPIYANAIYNSEGEFTIAILKDMNNNLLKNLNVTVKLDNGREYSNIKTNDNGQVRISIKDLIPDIYMCTILFSNSNYIESSSTALLKINKANSQIIIPSLDGTFDNEVNTVYNSGQKIVILLKDAYGNSLDGVKLTVKFSNGVTVTPTVVNGKAKVSTNGLKPVKKYTATITFNGNAKYEKSTAAVKVKVNKATPKITAKAKTFKRSDKKKLYTVKLLTNQNKAMKYTKVYIKVNNKQYTATTNKKGIATFSLNKLTKKGKYTAKIIYKESSYYTKLSKNVKITVK